MCVVCVYVHVFTHVCICTYRGQRLISHVFLHHSSQCMLRWVLLLKLRTDPDNLDSRGFSVSANKAQTLQASRYTLPTSAWFLVSWILVLILVWRVL